MASEIKPLLPITQAEKLPSLQEPFGTASTSNPERTKPQEPPKPKLVVSGKMDHPGVGASGSSSESSVDQALSLGRKKMASEIKPVLPITQRDIKKMASEIKPVLPITQAEKLPSLQEPFGTASTSNPRTIPPEPPKPKLVVSGKMDHPGVGASGSSSESDSTTAAETIELVNSVEEMLSGLAPRSPNYCIFRVPAKLREGNNEAYTPQVVSIGPLHRGKPELIGMEGYKMTYLKAFLDRTGMSVETCLKLIRDWEEMVRSRYAESISLNRDEFAKMVLVDSCFIIESMLRYWFNEKEEGISGLVRLDLILVENQLPFFIIRDIFYLAFTKDPPPFHEVLASYFEDDFLMKDLGPKYTDIGRYPIRHFADLLRNIHVPMSRLTSAQYLEKQAGICTENKRRSRQPSSVKEYVCKEYVRVQTATELKEADMKIKCRSSSSSEYFLHMNYNPKGVLEIPKFRVTDSTESMLRNLIALEVLLYQKESYIIDCVVFMDGLIDTARDVDVLVKNGVMDTYLGESEAVASMFNRLTLNVGLDTDKYHFCDLSKDVNKYCKVPRHKWMAMLKRDYFSTPFKVVSIIGAIVLLVLTLIQTVCSVISLYR